MTKKIVTMDDVAKRSGVSKTTVSRIINGIPNAASTETVENVLKAIDELGYYPNQVAASLKRTTTRTIGLIMGDIENPFYSLMIKGVEEVLTKSGYSLILANSNYNDELEVELGKLMLSKQVDAILIAPSGYSSCKNYRFLGERDTPVVFIDNYVIDCNADAVVVNNFEASREATEHLISLGHRDIAFIAGSADRISSGKRTKGYQTAIKEKYGQVDPSLMKRGDYTLDGGFRCMQELLHLPNIPTAVFIANNLMTVGALKAIINAGLSIPSDISILGFDDMYWYTINQPALTAVDQPAFEIGQTAAKRVIMRLKQKKQPSPEVIELKANLIIRDSTSPPRSHHVNPLE